MPCPMLFIARTRDSQTGRIPAHVPLSRHGRGARGEGTSVVLRRPSAPSTRLPAKVTG